MPGMMVVILVLRFLTDVHHLSFVAGLIVAMLALQVFYHRFNLGGPLDPGVQSIGHLRSRPRAGVAFGAPALDQGGKLAEHEAVDVAHLSQPTRSAPGEDPGRGPFVAVLGATA